MIPYCHAHGIGLIPWGPLHAGDLARPLSQDVSTARSEGKKGTEDEKPMSEADREVVRRLEEVAGKKGSGWGMSSVALAWAGGKVTSPIVGVSSVSEMFWF
jgi:aryl-alcohol dehydrogenase-like predicted oxidoreductase